MNHNVSIGLRDLSGRHKFGGVEIDHWHRGIDSDEDYSTVIKLQVDGETYLISEEKGTEVSLSEDPILSQGTEREVSIEYVEDDRESKLIVISEEEGGEKETLGEIHVFTDEVGRAILTLGGELEKEARERREEIEDIFHWKGHNKRPYGII